MKAPSQSRDPITISLSVHEDRFGLARVALKLGIRAGLSRKTALEISLAVAELATNAVRHGQGGTMRLRTTPAPRRGVEVFVVDRGPGLDAAGEAFVDGFSEGRRLGPDAPRRRGQGLGIGLGAVRRLMDEVHVERCLDGSHAIVARRWTDR
jgi:serine/threonine-protein kinase RsbT